VSKRSMGRWANYQSVGDGTAGGPLVVVGAYMRWYVNDVSLQD
jgi:hypothetical protein